MCGQHVSSKAVLLRKAVLAAKGHVGSAGEGLWSQNLSSQFGDGRTLGLQRPAVFPQPAPVTERQPLTGGTENGARWTADVQRGLGLVPWPVGADASQRLGPYFPSVPGANTCDIYFWPSHTSCDCMELSIKDLRFHPCQRRPM